MRARLSTIAFRLLVLTVVWLLGTAAFTLAQEGTTISPPPLETTTAAPEESQGPLVAPDVRGLPYVFAKGVLEEAGFAWKVKGKVGGYAVNVVKSQSVKPGTRVVDTGAPTIVLALAKNPSYEERGLPQKTAPYRGTRLLLVSGAEPVSAEVSPAAAAGKETGGTAEEDSEADAGAGTTAETEPEAEPEPEGTEPGTLTDDLETVDAEPEAEQAPLAVKPKAKPSDRPRAFVAPGAPREPLDEIPLPLRAKRLQARMAKATSLTDELVDHWRYQHAWIVTGAQFGWWHGAEALRILIKVDEAMQRRWNFAFRSEERARAALAEVQRRSR